MERIVGRSELLSEDFASSTSPEPEAREVLRRLTNIEFVNAGEASKATNLQEDDPTQADDDEGYEFRLFGSTKAVDRKLAEGGVNKIRLRSPPVSQGDAGLIRSERDRSYYFAKPLSVTEEEQFQSVAVNGEQVLARARRPWPGSSYPWKVLHLSLSNLNSSIRTEEIQTFRSLADHSLSTKRKRPGKKYRIKVRQKQALIQAQQDASKAAAEAKEAAEREKRTRRNREKKVKKRLRDKAKMSVATIDLDTTKVEDSAILPTPPSPSHPIR